MNEINKTVATTSVVRKPIRIPYLWIPLVLALVALIAGSPQTAARVFARVVVYGLVFFIIRCFHKLFSSKKTGEPC